MFPETLEFFYVPKSMKPKRTPSRRERIAAALRQAYLRFESDRQTKSFVLRLFPRPLGGARR